MDLDGTVFKSSDELLTLSSPPGIKGSRILDLGASCATLLPDDLNPSEVRLYATLPNSFSLMFLMKETRGHSRGGGHLAMHEMFGRLDSMCGPRVHTATFTMLSSPA